MRYYKRKRVTDKTVSVKDLAPLNKDMSRIENNEVYKNLNEAEPSLVEVYSEDAF